MIKKRDASLEDRVFRELRELKDLVFKWKNEEDAFSKNKGCGNVHKNIFGNEICGKKSFLCDNCKFASLEKGGKK